MKTAKEREEAFRHDLDELLKRHDAELTVTDDGRPYGMQLGICQISINGKWDENGEVLEEHTEFNL